MISVVITDLAQFVIMAVCSLVIAGIAIGAGILGFQAGVASNIGAAGGTVTVTQSGGTAFQSTVDAATIAITDSAVGTTVAFQGKIWVIGGQTLPQFGGGERQRPDPRQVTCDPHSGLLRQTPANARTASSYE